MSGESHRLSVVIPVYNCERYLAEAIESVLNQTRPPDEIIVVDDGSTDGSAAVAERFAADVQTLRQENLGIGEARNTGIKRAAGDFVAFLDADDVWMPPKLEIQQAVLEKEPQTDMVFGHAEQFVSPDIEPDDARRLQCAPQAVQGVICGTMLARKSVFETAGLFSGQWKVAEFIDWYARAMEQGLVAGMLDEVLLRRRIHLHNTGIVRRDSRNDYARVLKAALDRRRGKE